VNLADMRGNKLFRRAAVIAAISMLPSLATAAGLGKINVMSALGQPLLAEIDLVSVSAEEFPSLAARLASQDAYREANVEYPNGLGGFRFVIEKRASGQPYLKVVTNQPVNEPFLDLLIELNWASGRLLREYPVLLDPPGYNVAKSPTPAVTAPQAAAQPAPQARRAPAKPAQDSMAKGTAPSSANPVTAPSSTGAKEGSDTYGPIKSGETLREIAESVRPAEVTLDQMLVSLYRENKGAFIARNMNRVKKGMILKVPEASAITEISPAAAKREVVAQTADWNAYRKRVANIAARGAVQGEKAGQTAGGAIDAKVTDDKAPPDSGKDVLKLSKGQGAGAKAGDGGKGADNAAQEELAARDRALEDARTRISDLEKQINEMRRLLELKGSPVLTQKPPMPVPAPEAAPGDTATAAITPPAPSVEMQSKPAPEAQPEVKPETPEAESKPPVEATPKKPKRVMPPPPTPAAESGFFGGLLENPLIPAAGAALLGLLGFLGYRQFRKRKDAQLGAFTATGAIPGGFKVGQAPAAASPATLTPEGGNSSFLSDFDKVGAGNIDTDEVDPVAEADVYIAYGRDAQAEEILKEAMVKDSSRYEIPLKLLEIYSNRKSAPSFETIAKQLHSTIGAQHPLWSKVAEMGRKLDATNALYAAVSVAASSNLAGESTVIRAVNREMPPPKPAEEVPSSMRDTLTVKEPAVTNSPLDLDLDFDATASEPRSVSAENLSPNTGTLDLDLGSSSEQATGDFDLGSEVATVSADPFVLDFELDAPKPAAAGAPKAEAPSIMDNDGGLDFDLSPADAPEKPKVGSATAPSSVDLPPLDLSDIDLSLGSASERSAPSNGGGGGGWQSAETKLDLARAYLEIGDKVGAVEILQEVIKEGSPEQQDEAKKLAAQA
jgi:pilus assembly protein FimV